MYFPAQNPANEDAPAETDCEVFQQWHSVGITAGHRVEGDEVCRRNFWGRGDEVTLAPISDV
jgi:hypothetical protein